VGDRHRFDPEEPEAGLMPAETAQTKRVRAFLLSDRIDVSNFEHDGVVSTAPLTYKFGDSGFVTLFRYGVVVTSCLSPEAEDQVIVILIAVEIAVAAYQVLH
jgi:hypothetical protein